MRKNIYDRSVETRELQLIGFGPNWSHFGLIGLLLFMPVMMLYLHLLDYFQGNPDPFQDGELFIIIIPPILAAVVYVIQKRRLRFRIIQTKLNHVQLKEILINVANELEWEFISSTNDVYVAKTSPGFFSGSWGEQITVLFYKDLAFINSICDPNKRPSVVSWGRNRKNEETFIDKIILDDNQSTIVAHPI